MTQLYSVIYSQVIYAHGFPRSHFTAICPSTGTRQRLFLEITFIRAWVKISTNLYQPPLRLGTCHYFHHLGLAIIRTTSTVVESDRSAHALRLSPTSAPHCVSCAITRFLNRSVLRSARSSRGSTNQDLPEQHSEY